MRDYENSRSSQGRVEEFSAENFSDGTPSVPLNGNNIPPAYLCNGKMTNSFRLSQFGMTLEPLTESRGEGLLTWFREVFLAKTSVPQEVVPVLMEKGLACGLSLPESLAKLDHGGYWLKTPTTCEPKVLDEFSKTWPSSGMMLRGGCFPLKTVEPITNARECGLLPTPTAHNAKEGGYPAEGTRNTPTLGWVVGGKINPQLTEWMMGWPIGWTGLKPLETDKYQSWLQQHSNSCPDS